MGIPGKICEAAAGPQTVIMGQVRRSVWAHRGTPVFHIWYFKGIEPHRLAYRTFNAVCWKGGSLCHLYRHRSACILLEAL